MRCNACLAPPQDKCEPPMYVSDRRFMKVVQLLQVVAHADGRSEVRACRDGSAVFL